MHSNQLFNAQFSFLTFLPFFTSSLLPIGSDLLHLLDENSSLLPIGSDLLHLLDEKSSLLPIGSDLLHFLYENSSLLPIGSDLLHLLDENPSFKPSTVSLPSIVKVVQSSESSVRVSFRPYFLISKWSFKSWFYEILTIFSALASRFFCFSSGKYSLRSSEFA